jgi:hypothetical protein
MSAFGGKADGHALMSAFDPKRTFGGQYPENLNEPGPSGCRVGLPSLIASLSPGFLTLLTVRCCSKDASRFYFGWHGQHRCSQSGTTKSEHFSVAKRNLCVQLFVRHFWLHLPLAYFL